MNALWLRLITYAALVAAVILAYQWFVSHQQSVGYNRAMNEVAIEQAALANERRQRELESQAAANLEAKNAQERIQKLERERNTARADADRLRIAVNRFAQRVGVSSTDAAGTSEGESGAATVRMLADMLIRADQRAEAVGVFADQLYIAGDACERTYDQVNQP